jgi:hypothetical protein
MLLPSSDRATGKYRKSLGANEAEQQHLGCMDVVQTQKPRRVWARHYGGQVIPSRRAEQEECDSRA